MSATFDLSARDILSRYSALFSAAELLQLGNRGGFSGARLWRVEVSGQSFCLRAWPFYQSDPTRLDFLHALMRHARAAGLPFVPAVIAAANGRDHVERQGRLWDLTEWLPGRANFLDCPSTVRLEAASIALAQMHNACEKLHATDPDVCPALRRRLAAATEWQTLRRSGWRARWDTANADPVKAIAERAWRVLDRRIARIPERLRLWENRRVRLQPCLCDVWHDHLLFEGDRLTGLIDYGAVKIDHPAVDIARMLGSLVPDDLAAWQVGLTAYRRNRPFSDDDADLALALDETGTAIGVATWLRWLYEEDRQFEDRTAIARRLAVLVERLEKWDRR